MGFLAQVATASGWEGHVERDLRQAGFGRVQRVPSLGGAITWVWAWVPGSGVGPDSLDLEAAPRTPLSGSTGSYESKGSGTASSSSSPPPSGGGVKS
jgi:hypothetical protein